MLGAILKSGSTPTSPFLRDYPQEGNRQSKTEEDGAGNGFGAAAEMALHWDSLWNKQPPESQLLITTKVLFFLLVKHLLSL